MMSDQKVSIVKVRLTSLVMASVAASMAGCGWIGPSSGRDVIETPGWTSTATTVPDPRYVDSPTTPPEQIVQDRATVAYLAMWADLLAAGRSSDWDSPRLDDHASDHALAELTQRLRASHRRGLVVRGKLDFNPIADPAHEWSTAVTITDCVDDLKWLSYRASSGDLVDDGPRGRHRVNALVKKHDDGAWKVFRFSMDGVGTC